MNEVTEHSGQVHCEAEGGSPEHLANLQTADNITREETVLSTFPRQASNTISPFPLLVLFPGWTSFVYKKYLTSLMPLL